MTIPLAGHLSDLIGRKRMYLIGAVATGIFGFIYFAMLDTTVPILMFLAIVLSFVPHDLMYGPQAKLIAECFTPRMGKHEGKIDIRGRLLRHPSQRRQNDCDGARDHRAAQLRGVICSDNVRVAMPIVAIGRLPRLGRTCVGALTHLLRRVCPLVREILAGVSHFLRSV